MKKIYNNRYFTLVIFALLHILSIGQLLSQTKYTVLLPDTDIAIERKDDNLRISANSIGTETSKSFFKFNFNYLPQYAKIGQLNLKMYNLPGTSMSDFSAHLVTVLMGPNTWTGNETDLNDPKLSWANINNNQDGPIGRDEVKKSSSSINMKLKIPGSPKYVSSFLPSGILSLAARSPVKGHDTKFYSSKTTVISDDFSKTPKLLVSYEIDPFPFREDWAQPFATAQHNSFLNWKTNATTTSVMVRKLPNKTNDQIVGADPTGAIAVYKNLPIIFTQAASGTSSVFYVKQLDSKGNELWVKGVDDVAKCWPLIDELGRLYYISRAGKLSILDLNNEGNILFSKALSEITNNQVSMVSDNSNATIGYDGTLYLPTDRGIVVLSAYPQLKIRWKYNQKINEINGSVSISPDESKAFFINVKITPEPSVSRLITLDNSDGSLLDSSDYVLGGYRNDKFYIPAPVVQNNSRVFVLNGYDNSSQLFVFDIDKKGSISKTQSISSGSSVNSGISQPVIDGASNVYFVFNNKLARYNKSTNKAEVFNDSQTLDNASILVTNASSDIFATDIYSTPKKIVGFKYDTNFQNTFSVNIDSVTIGNTKKNIVLAADGTLYTVTANNLIAITPSKVSVDDLILSLPDIENNKVYRASSSITVNDFSVQPTVNTIFYSGGSISFKPGFSVAKGAQITCKTGY